MRCCSNRRYAGFFGSTVTRAAACAPGRLRAGPLPQQQGARLSDIRFKSSSRPAAQHEGPPSKRAISHAQGLLFAARCSWRLHWSAADAMSAARIPHALFTASASCARLAAPASSTSKTGRRRLAKIAPLRCKRERDTRNPNTAPPF